MLNRVNRIGINKVVRQMSTFEPCRICVKPEFCKKNTVCNVDDTILDVEMMSILTQSSKANNSSIEPSINKVSFFNSFCESIDITVDVD